MRPPRDLQPAGRRAWRQALAAMAAVGADPGLLPGALERYARAVDLLAALQRAWEADGRVLIPGDRGGEVVNPLLRELRFATKAVGELAQALMPPAAAGWRRGQPRSPDRAARGGPRAPGARLIPLSDRVEQALADAEP